MYQNPKRAKKLYNDVVPKAVDEYLECIEKEKNQTEIQKLLNPAWHVHNGNVPKEKIIIQIIIFNYRIKIKKSIIFKIMIKRKNIKHNNSLFIIVFQNKWIMIKTILMVIGMMIKN